MRIPLKLMSLTAALTIVPLISAQSTKSAKKPSFSIAINAEDVVKADSNVPLDIILTNTSDKDMSSGEILGGAELNYDIDVRGSKGELAPETSFGRKLHHKDPGFTLGGSVVAYHLKPGRTHETRSFLNRVYDLSQPGKYTIQVQRRDPGSNTIVKSNATTITVVP
jgi:hypothetical protein